MKRTGLKKVVQAIISNILLLSMLVLLVSFLFYCSCSFIESHNENNKTEREEETIEKSDFFDESLTEKQKELLSGVVTLDILESIVGELTFEYIWTAPSSLAYTYHVYKGINEKQYALEFLNDGSIIACRDLSKDNIYEDRGFLFYRKESIYQHFVMVFSSIDVSCPDKLTLKLLWNMAKE